jgi:hypothetical protein
MWSKLADDTNQQIKGYASATTVSQNQNITFYVTVNPVQNYTIDFYRFGWYGGAGARLRLHVGPISGFQQAPCPTDAQTGMIACNWTPSYTLSVPSDWTSGVYAAMLTNDQGFQNYAMFVVRDGRPAPFLYQQSVSTDQAYNNYPNDGLTGKSLYGFNSYGANTVSGTTAAVKVSFDRPHSDSGLGQFYKWELNTIRWLERSGYDVTYSTNIDTHTNGAELRNHRAFLRSHDGTVEGDAGRCGARARQRRAPRVLRGQCVVHPGALRIVRRRRAEPRRRRIPELPLGPDGSGAGTDDHGGFPLVGPPGADHDRGSVQLFVAPGRLRRDE